MTIIKTSPFSSSSATCTYTMNAEACDKVKGAFKDILPEESRELLITNILHHLNNPQAANYRVKTSAITFWVKIDTRGASIRFNIPSSVIGFGAVKKAKYALEVALDTLAISHHVRLRPLDKTRGWNPSALTGFTHHKMLWDALKHRGALSCIATPPERCSEMEYLQPYYPGTLMDAKSPKFGVEKIFSEFYALFSTIDSIHRHGLMHRDIKFANIMRDENYNLYINDFDQTGFNFHGTKGEYEFWDKATQRGLHNPYADVVGGIVCMLFALFPETYGNLCLPIDPEHYIFRIDSLTTIADTLKIEKEDPYRDHKMRFLELARKVFEGEERIYSAITSSLMHFFMRKGTFNGQTQDAFNTLTATIGLSSYIVEQLNQKFEPLAAFLNQKGYPITLDTIEEILNYFSKKQEQNEIEEPSELEELLDFFLPTLSEASQLGLFELAIVHKDLEGLIFDEATIKGLDPAFSSDTLFLQLNSNDAQEREKGYQTLWKLAPSAYEVQREIGAIYSKMVL